MYNTTTTTTRRNVTRATIWSHTLRNEINENVVMVALADIIVVAAAAIVVVA